MRREWDCPKDCPNRKIGCQNPNTCTVYAKRIQRRQKQVAAKRVYPDRYVPRSTPTQNGYRKMLPK